jgi:hypothetical protein
METRVVFAKRLMAAAAFFTSVVGISAVTPLDASPSMSSVVKDGTGRALSVMTYNVEGLPFPVAFNRTASLQEIGLRLAALRQRGAQPHVVLLQEAFTPEAKSIARLAGYRYVAYGPQIGDMARDGAPVMPATYRADAQWNKGETEGKWVDSGLLILSDLPIERTARMAFASDACAGYDCLAAKGVLLAWVRVPGQAQPVAIADAHLNSRRATGVSDERADAAFTEQYREAHAFIAGHVNAATSIVFGGDFNIGHGLERRALVASGAPIPGVAAEATRELQSNPRALPSDSDLKAVLQRAKDVQFFHAGAGKQLRLTAVQVPFGIKAGGFSLSDHLGYVATYRY